MPTQPPPRGAGKSQLRPVSEPPRDPADIEAKKLAWYARRFQSYGGPNLFNMECPDMEWLIDGLVPRTGYGFLAGLPKTGKTWAALSMMFCILSGKPWCGRRTHPPTGPGLYLAEEGSLPSFIRRCQFLRNGYDFDPNTWNAHFEIWHQPRMFLDDPNDFRDLRIGLDMLKPSFIVFDCLSRLHACDENSRNDMENKVLNPLKQLCNDMGTCMMVIHHSRDPIKMGKGATKFDPLRGSQALRGWHEFLLWFEPHEGKQLFKGELRNARAPQPTFIQYNIDDDRKTAVLEVEEYEEDTALIANFTRNAEHGKYGSDGKKLPGTAMSDEVFAGLRAAVGAMLRTSPVTVRQVRDTFKLRPHNASRILDSLAADGIAVAVDTGLGYVKYALTEAAARQISLELDDSSDGEEETYMSDTADLPDYDE